MGQAGSSPRWHLLISHAPLPVYFYFHGVWCRSFHFSWPARFIFVILTFISSAFSEGVEHRLHVLPAFQLQVPSRLLKLLLNTTSVLPILNQLILDSLALLGKNYIIVLICSITNWWVPILAGPCLCWAIHLLGPSQLPFLCLILVHLKKKSFLQVFFILP